jgi:CubicO group peptidase (beta-lactamase class C family)
MSEAAAKETQPAAKTGVAALDDLFKPVDRTDAPGLVVGVARAGKLVYRKGFGLASIEHGVANTPWTRMRIGSTSKHFTCLAALLLVEDGKLDIDVGVRTYLPELPETKPEPTLRQFMQHTSGLRDYLDVGFLASGMTIKPKGVALATQALQSDVNFAPGEKMIYNNGGYHMLSLVIERVSGMPFEQFLKERIFDPLGMVDTRSVPSDFEIHRGTATLHVPQADGSWRRGVFPTEEVRGEGAIVSTIDDMLGWLKHLRGPHTVGSESSWKQMLAPARLSNGFETHYALGLQVEKYRGVDIIHHGGTVIGGTCQMLTVPAHELDIVIISNGAMVMVSDLATKVIDAMLGEEALPQPAETTAATEHFKPLVGANYYSPSTGLVMGFGDAGGKLGFVIHNSPPIPVREDSGELCLDFSKIAVGPHTVAVGRLAADAAAPQTLQLTEAGTVRVLERMPEAVPAIAEAGKSLVGRYRVPDLDARAEARIAFEGDALVVRIASEYGPNLLTVKVLSADVFSWNFTGQLDKLGGTFHVERKNGKVDGLRFNTLRTRHVRFERLPD